ncbi:hypothetical protein M8J76_004834 [Diaphorina citri]|nr:hypothetical protein M8J76_004834 [Diaphorina citri]
MCLWAGVRIPEGNKIISLDTTNMQGLTFVLLSWSEPTTFTADHPFLYVIREKAINAVVFGGKVAKLTAK